MDLTPLVQRDRQVIERYGPAGFRISGSVYLGPVLVFPDHTELWADAAITAVSLAPIVVRGVTELLLLGLGKRMAPLAAALRAELKRHGIAVEPMDTGAACRTYNVLLVEDRHVAAALLPPI